MVSIRSNRKKNFQIYNLSEKGNYHDTDFFRDIMKSLRIYGLEFQDHMKLEKTCIYIYIINISFQTILDSFDSDFRNNLPDKIRKKR